MKPAKGNQHDPRPGPSARPDEMFTPEQWNALARRFRLTPRESEAARLILRGLKESAIARAMGITATTVHDHAKALHIKFGVSDKAELCTQLMSELASVRDHTGHEQPQRRRKPRT